MADYGDYGDYVGDDEYPVTNNSAKEEKFDRGYRPTKLNTIRGIFGKPQEESYLLEPIIQRLKSSKVNYASSDYYETKKNEIKNFSKQLEAEINGDSSKLAEARKYAEKLASENNSKPKNYANEVLSHKLNYILNGEGSKFDRLRNAANTNVESLLRDMWDNKRVAQIMKTLESYNRIGGKRSRRNKTGRKSRKGRRGTRRLRK